MRPRRLVLWATLALLAALAVGLWRFATPWLAQALIARVDAQLPGELALDGALEWQLVPPAFTASGLRWSAPGASLTVDRLSVRSEWQADASGARPIHVSVDGVRAELRQDADGRWPLPVLPAGGEGPRWRLDALRIDDLQLRLQALEGPPIAVRSARGTALREGEKMLAVKLDWGVERGTSGAAGQLEGMLAQDGEAQRLALRFSARHEGIALDDARLSMARLARAPDGALRAAGVAAAGRVSQGGRRLEVDAQLDADWRDGRLQAALTRLGVRQVSPEPASLALREVQLALDGEGVRLAPLTGEARLADVAIDFEDGRAGWTMAEQALDFTLPTLAATVPDPAREGDRLTVHAGVDGRIAVEPVRGAGTLALRADGSHVEGHWQLDATRPRWARLEAEVDTLDLDRWTAPGRRVEAAPLDAWRDLPLELDLRVGRLRWRGVTARDARLRIGQ